MLHLMLLACTDAAPRRAAPAPVDTGAPVDSAAPPDSGVPVDSAAPPDSGAPDDSAFPEAPAVSFLSPSNGATVTNPVRFSLRLTDVSRASLDADGYAIGEVSGAGDHTLAYTFSGTGYPRVLTLTGYDDADRAVASDGITIEVSPDEVSVDVPYFYQYDNVNEPGSTCGVTSAAMLVTYWNPGSVTPDTLYRTYGKAQGQSPSGLAELYAAEGLDASYGTRGTRAELRALLDAGQPVVVHGYWTSAGHIAVLVGYTDTDWIVNDPAGDWYTCYGCGPADHVRYPLGGAWDEEMSADGDIWWSTAAP